MSQTEVRAGISGTVIEVSVAKGSRVEEGDTIVTMEAMKMEMPELAPCAGEVVELFVVQGQVVEQDYVIAVIRPD